jgi:hypothetical protein
LPRVHLRGYAATVDTTLRVFGALAIVGSHPGEIGEDCLPSHLRAPRYGGQAEARPKGERRMVDQNSASWNQIAGWLRQLEVLRDAA